MAKISMGKNDKATKAKGSSSGVKSDLKANNAGYSTTNSRGETTYYKSSRDAEAGNALKTVKAGTNVPVMTPQNMTATSPANIPTKPTASDPGDVVGANNAGLASMLGYTLDANGQFQAPKADAGTSQDMSRMGNIFGSYIASKEAPPSLADIYKDEYKDAGIKNLQSEVNNYTSSLNSIVAKQQADLLRVRGAGSENGVTEAVYGGQQATINREAAIAALPVQAALSAAQGNLELAQAHVDKMFQIRSQDATAQYNYKNTLLDSVYNFATTVEQKRLDGLKTQEDRKYQEKLSNIQTMNEWAKLAVETGQSGLVSRIMSLDPSSPTFATSFGALQGQVRKPVAAAGAPETKNFGTDAAPVWKQYNRATGTWENVSGLDPASTGGYQDPANLEAKYSELLRDIGDAKKLADDGAVGAGNLERWGKSLFTSNPDYAQVENIADTIKSNLLTLNTDPNIKKFFGPQMSNRDTELMTGAASTLNPVKQTREQFVRDLQDAAQLISRARLAVTVAAPQQTVTGITTSPDGVEIQIID